MGRCGSGVGQGLDERAGQNKHHFCFERSKNQSSWEARLHLLAHPRLLPNEPARLFFDKYSNPEFSVIKLTLQYSRDLFVKSYVLDKNCSYETALSGLQRSASWVPLATVLLADEHKLSQ
jgi:hypothetical protein